MGLTELSFRTARMTSARPTRLISGVKLETARGWQTVETLEAGMSVQTFDGGLREIVDMKLLQLSPYLLEHFPEGLTLVPGGALNNCEPFYVVPGQELLIRSEPVSALLGQGAALVRAEFMEGYRGICRTLPVDELSIAIVSFAEDEVVWANTGALMHCDGRGSAQTFFPRPGPGESLRIAAQMIAQDEQTQAVLAA